MSKLPKEHQFVDLSDYGRPIARAIASSLINTSVTPIQVTLGFIVSGLLGIACIVYGYYWAAGFFLIFKSILDAADGELARLKKTPSYTGRYFDSVSDIILNMILLGTIHVVTSGIWYYTVLAFIGLQLQGTLYNYYYVILRTKLQGDTTSRVMELEAPTALAGEKQSTVNRLFYIYYFFYAGFDKAIYQLDKTAIHGQIFPTWFMTSLSIFGLGFQLLFISLMLVLELTELIIPSLIVLTLLVFVFISIRKIILK